MLGITPVLHDWHERKRRWKKKRGGGGEKENGIWTKRKMREKEFTLKQVDTFPSKDHEMHITKWDNQLLDFSLLLATG